MTHTPSGSSRQHFQAILDDWAAAIIANDATRIDGFVDPDWVLVGPEGGPVEREAFLAAVRSGHLTHADMTFEVLTARTYGTTAVVLAHGVNHGHWRGDPFTADEWVTEMFVRRGDRWRCTFSALTPNLAAGKP
jgi:ketosteroid isomerase-like protein